MRKAAAGVNTMAWPLAVSCAVPPTRMPFWATWMPPLTVVVSSGALTKSVMVVVVATRTAPVTGRWAVTTGRVAAYCGPVVKLLVKSASAFPGTSVIACVATIVIVVSGGSGPGVNVTVRLSVERVGDAPSEVIPLRSCNVLTVTVLRSSDLEKVTTIVDDSPTLVAPLAGVTDRTCGGVVSAVPAVVN